MLYLPSTCGPVEHHPVRMRGTNARSTDRTVRELSVKLRQPAPTRPKSAADSREDWL
jgi:hypothetical protein